MLTITRVYHGYDQARRAVEANEAAGFPGAQISLVANKYVSAEFADVERVSAPATGAGIGGVLGGSAGFLAGLGLLAIPGLGPVVAAGWLASTAVGAAAGAAAGGLVGALVGVGLSHDEANAYAETIRRGGTLVSVRVRPGDIAQVRAILDRFMPVDADRRIEEYHREGWTDFDAKAPPYRPSQSEIERIRKKDVLAA
ncbi:MAG: hypothetical protein AB7F22_29750 [Reyranella sp.]|uniref:hypothetical protein n=1 Tax=Reyranella sp. TaxID=1929291 RepID=UPI003D0B3457